MGRSPNVLLIVFDTLRPDFLSTYGGPFARVTPGFDDVANRGVLFENAFAVGQNTPISHGALFTGQYPSTSGLLGGLRPVPEDVPTVAAWLREHGYDTFAVSRKSGNLSSELGHNRGFDRFFEPDKENAHPEPSLSYFRTAFSRPLYFKEFLRTLRDGPDQLTNMKFNLFQKYMENSTEPFFGFINQITPHAAYRPPRPYMERAAPSFSRPRFHIVQRLLEAFELEPERLDHPAIRPERVLKAGIDLQPYVEDPEYLNEREETIIRQWYGAEVSYLDRRFTQFLDWFYQSSFAENTILIVTADHGEHLGEHGLHGHSHFLFDEVLHVPLAVAGPGVPAGKRNERLVSLLDVFDTVCDLCDLPSPEATAGKSMFGEKPRDAIFAEYGIRDLDKMRQGFIEGPLRERLEAGRKCIRTTDYKYVLGSNGEDHLYELPSETEVEDPDQSLVDELYAELVDVLGDNFRRQLEHDEADISDEARENLRELGYID